MVIFVVAAAGGFLGGLLELARCIVLGFLLLGAVAGFVIWRALRSFLDRWS